MAKIWVAYAVMAAAAVGGVAQTQVASHKASSRAKDQSTAAAAQIAETKKANAAAAAKAEEESAAIAAQEQQDIATAEAAATAKKEAESSAIKKTTEKRRLALEETGRPSTFASGNTFGLRSAAPVKKKKLGQ